MNLEVVNPYNQEICYEVPFDDGSPLEGKIQIARDAFELWRHVPLEKRALHVKEGIDRLRAAAPEIAREVSLQMGKPISQANQEVQTCCARAEHMLSIASKTLAPEVLPSKEGFHLRIEHAPLGVVLNLAAWNYPLLIPVNVVVPAILAGNSVLLKHSARTPLCGYQFERAFGCPDLPGLISSLVVRHETVTKLLADPRVDHVAFTGSVEGGREVYRQASRRFIEVGLELGGKDPAYVAEDANLLFSVENIVDGACYNAGQSCCAVERVYVHEKRYSEFLLQAKELLERYRMGDPFDVETSLGPLASRSALDFLEHQVEDAVHRGARLLLGGKRVSGAKGNFFPPTLLADVPNDAEVMQEESFGPIVPVLSVKNDEEALVHMQDTRFGLTASVWTRDRDRAEHFASQLDTGTVFQNRCDFLDPALPWTGVHDSGKGTTLSRFGFYGLTRRKSFHFRVEAG